MVDGAIKFTTIIVRCFQIAASTCNLLTASAGNSGEHCGRVTTEFELIYSKSSKPLRSQRPQRFKFFNIGIFKSTKDLPTLMISITERTRCATQGKTNSSNSGWPIKPFPTSYLLLTK
jgi:hypothetical protein